jgi:nicotinate-nucleotide adenylyltransferase
MTEKIGIFGGTFDPPHLGHLILASEAWATLSLTRLLWVIAPDPPHKQSQAVSPLHHRLAMLERALAEDEAFEISTIEMEREGPHYSVDTMRLLREARPSAEFTFLIGGDSLRDIPSWHHPSEFLALCDALGVMRRPGDSIDLTALESALPGISEKIRFIDAPLLEISSREIRRRVAEGKPFRYYLPPKVYEYIREHRLYHS